MKILNADWLRSGAEAERSRSEAEAERSGSEVERKRSGAEAKRSGSEVERKRSWTRSELHLTFIYLRLRNIRSCAVDKLLTRAQNHAFCKT